MYAYKLFQLAMDNKEETLEDTEYEVYTSYKNNDFINLKNLKNLTLTTDYLTFVEMAYQYILGREIDTAGKAQYEQNLVTLSEIGFNNNLINDLKVECVNVLINSQEFINKGKSVYNIQYFQYNSQVQNNINKYCIRKFKKYKFYNKVKDWSYHKVFLKLPLYVQRAIKKGVYKVRGIK